MYICEPTIKGYVGTHYVYHILHNKRSVYIGKGTVGGLRTRYESHLCGNSHNKRLVSFLEGKCVLVLVKPCWSNEEANTLEIKLIAKYSPLFNYTAGGDGGLTHQGTKAYLNPNTGKVSFLHRKPRKWVRYRAKGTTGLTYAYNPSTLRMIRIRPGEIPDGYIAGMRPDKKNGPTKGFVVAHYKGRIRFFDSVEDVPRNYTLGRPSGSTQNRIACYCTKTFAIKFVKGNVPKGYKEGFPPNKVTGGSKQYEVEGVIYPSVQHAMVATGLTRYKLYRAYGEP